MQVSRKVRSGWLGALAPAQSGSERGATNRVFPYDVAKPRIFF